MDVRLLDGSTIPSVALTHRCCDNPQSGIELKASFINTGKAFPVVACDNCKRIIGSLSRGLPE